MSKITFSFFFFFSFLFLPPFRHLQQLHPHDFATSGRLEQRQDFGQTLIPHLFEVTQQACFEEHLHEKKHCFNYKIQTKKCGLQRFLFA